MPHSLNRNRPAQAAALALALPLLSLAVPAHAATFSVGFDLTVTAAFDPVSGAPRGPSALLGQTGTVEVSFNVDTSGLAANDILNVFNDQVDSFAATLFGQSFDRTQTTDVLTSPFGPGHTPVATLVAGADIASDPSDLQLSFFGFGVSERETITTLAGDFTYDTATLTAITEPGVAVFVALYAPFDAGGFLSDGETGVAVVDVGVVPAPPALGLAMTALAGLAVAGRRRRATA